MPYIEVKVYIRPMNHVPVIADGGDRIVFNHPDTLLSPNSFLNKSDRLKLKPPFSLFGEVSAEDPDGDQLTWASCGLALIKHHTINSRFSSHAYIVFQVQDCISA